MTKTGLFRLAIYLPLWGLGLATAIGLAVFTRDFITCWRLTSLPGIPSTGCAGKPVNVVETPVILKEQKPTTPTPTSEPLIPDDLDYPTWDGDSRINILFVGFRGGDPIKGD